MYLPQQNVAGGLQWHWSKAWGRMVWCSHLQIAIASVGHCWNGNGMQINFTSHRVIQRLRRFKRLSTQSYAMSRPSTLVMTADAAGWKIVNEHTDVKGQAPKRQLWAHRLKRGDMQLDEACLAVLEEVLLVNHRAETSAVAQPPGASCIGPAEALPRSNWGNCCSRPVNLCLV